MIAVAGQISIEVSYDPLLLFVAMKVFDVTAGLPGSIVGAAIPMVEFDTGNYAARFTGVAGKLYAISKAVYTDGTYATRDSNYAPGSDALQVISSLGGSGLTIGDILPLLSSDLIAEVDDYNEIEAEVDDC